MKAKKLSSKQIGKSNCFLCEIYLKDYMEALKPDFDKYTIQRGFVKNNYLETMVSTILDGKHIPVITLVSETDLTMLENNLVNIENESFEILDGLQRTFRIKSVYEIFKIIKANYSSFKESKLSYELKKQLATIDSNGTRVAEAIVKRIAISSIDAVEKMIGNTILWVEVWTGLTQKEVVEKMLLLNAGHKQVKIKHQLEILFLGLETHLTKAIADLKLTKEKEAGNISTFAKTREIGEFKLADLILGYVAYYMKNCKITSSDILDSNLYLSSGETLEDLYKINCDDVENYVRFLVRADKIIFDCYKDLGRAWLAKETVIVGLSSSVGDFTDGGQSIDYLLKILSGNIVSLNLTEYEESRNNMEASKVNIGDVTKKAVNKSIVEFFRSPKKKINWQQAFKV